MFFTVRAKDKTGDIVLVNSDRISYLTQSLDGGCIIYFGEHILVSLDSFSLVSSKLNPPISKISTENVPVQISNTIKNSLVPSDGFPSHLPRMPNGNIDKRTSAYKEYAASLI